MKYKDLLVQLNELVKISQLFPNEALILIRGIQVPEEFQPLVNALEEYIQFKQSNLIEFLKNLPKD